MQITVLCSDPGHPVHPRLKAWVDHQDISSGAVLVNRLEDASGGDLLFLVSCSEFVGKQVRDRYKHCLVLHASALPEGRGWSPHVWSIIQGARRITVTLLEAAEHTDTGRIWSQSGFDVEPHMLWDEINVRLFDAELGLMDFAVKNLELVQPRVQDPSIAATHWPRRTPADSRIDPHASIASQFNLMRVCDPKRFPAHFELHGHRYRIILEKMDD